MRMPLPRSAETVERMMAEIDATVDIPRGSLPLDPSVRPLVAGLIRWHVKTLWSCEDHGEPGEMLYVSIDKTHASRALHLVGEWWLRTESKFEWALTARFVLHHGDDGMQETWAYPFFNFRPMRPKAQVANTRHERQQDALAFGDYLLNRPRIVRHRP